jgi:hypothetical protein
MDEFMGQSGRRGQAYVQRTLCIWSQMVGYTKNSLRLMCFKVNYCVQMVRLGSYADFYEYGDELQVQ